MRLKEPSRAPLISGLQFASLQHEVWTHDQPYSSWPFFPQQHQTHRARAMAFCHGILSLSKNFLCSHTPIIPAFRRHQQEDKFEASLIYQWVPDQPWLYKRDSIFKKLQFLFISLPSSSPHLRPEAKEKQSFPEGWLCLISSNHIPQSKARLRRMATDSQSICSFCGLIFLLKP